MRYELLAIRQSAAETDVAVRVGTSVVAVGVEHTSLSTIVPVAPTLKHASFYPRSDCIAFNKTAYYAAYLCAFFSPNVIFFKRQIAQLHT